MDTGGGSVSDSSGELAGKPLPTRRRTLTPNRTPTAPKRRNTGFNRNEAGLSPSKPKSERLACPLPVPSPRRQMIERDDLLVGDTRGRIRLRADRLLLLVRPKKFCPPHHSFSLVSTVVGGHCRSPGHIRENPVSAGCLAPLQNSSEHSKP